MPIVSLPDVSGGLFDELDRLRRDYDGRFASPFGPSGIRSASRGLFPAINIAASAERVEVLAFAPGVDPGSLDVSLHDRVLTIKGERTVAAVQENAPQNHRRERFSGPFERAVTLTADLDVDGVEARYEHGVLRVTIGRPAKSVAQRIEVK